MQHGMRQMQLHELEVEEAEDSLISDWLDNMTPTAISTERFKRNHMWLEEVLSSIYSVNHILPEDLGFGLAGELADLTKDFLNAQDVSPQRRAKGEPLGPIDQNAVYYSLGPEKLAELEQKIADYVDANDESMDDMRKEHAKRMGRLNQGKFYLEADQRLRDAAGDEKLMDELLHNVEAQLGVRVQEGQELVCVQQGTLQQDGKELNGDGPNGQSGTGDDTAAGLLDEFTSNVEYTHTEATAPANDNLHLMDMDVAASKGEDDWVVVENREQGLEAGTGDGKAHADDGEAQQHGAETSDVMQPESMFEEAEFDAFAMSGEYDEGGDSLLNFGGGFGGDASGGLP